MRGELFNHKTFIPSPSARSAASGGYSRPIWWKVRVMFFRTSGGAVGTLKHFRIDLSHWTPLSAVQQGFFLVLLSLLPLLNPTCATAQGKQGTPSLFDTSIEDLMKI